MTHILFHSEGHHQRRLRYANVAAYCFETRRLHWFSTYCYDDDMVKNGLGLSLTKTNPQCLLRFDFRSDGDYDIVPNGDHFSRIWRRTHSRLVQWVKPKLFVGEINTTLLWVAGMDKHSNYRLNMNIKYAKVEYFNRELPREVAV